MKKETSSCDPFIHFNQWPWKRKYSKKNKNLNQDQTPPIDLFIMASYVCVTLARQIQLRCYGYK